MSNQGQFANAVQKLSTEASVHVQCSLNVGQEGWGRSLKTARWLISYQGGHRPWSIHLLQAPPLSHSLSVSWWGPQCVLQMSDPPITGVIWRFVNNSFQTVERTLWIHGKTLHSTRSINYLLHRSWVVFVPDWSTLHCKHQMQGTAS